MAKFGIGVLLCIIVFSCNKTKDPLLKEGVWLAQLEVQDKEMLPFNFNLYKTEGANYTIDVYNAEEVVKIEEIELKNDSIRNKMPVFEGYIEGIFTDTSITGFFVKESLDRVVPFKATFGEKERFRPGNPATSNISGIWETEFSPNTPDSYMAKGIFTQNGSKIKGTFRTTTGDYRYLEGLVIGDSIKLSTFDGAHAFLFTAKITDSTLNGFFYSGNHFKEPFVGNRNEGFELPHEDSLTFLKEGYDKLAFSFPDANGNMVSLDQKRFNNKVVIVQIMGTWCPNCLDETKFLVNYLKENNNTDLEVVALAFEYAKTSDKAFEGINRLKERIGTQYPILLAQYGSSNKGRAQEKLPMLNHILSYPTTIFIDKKSNVRKIHTGFNGPATGEKYILFKKEFDDFVQSLLNE